MDLVAVPAFADNYIWMLHDGVRAIVVDPGDAAPVRETLVSRRLRLAGILVTHHHRDHVGGLEGLRPLLEGPVFAPAHEAVAGDNVKVEGGRRIEVAGLAAEVIDVPGHTAGHIAYWLDLPGADPVLFCGDTLFSAGCGRLFEGTPAQMHASLSRLAALPGATRVCCGHEYTVANLRFALAVEPGNAAAAAQMQAAEALRARGEPTLPSTIARERAINPFLRCGEPAVVEAAAAHGAAGADGTAVFAALREWKNGSR